MGYGGTLRQISASIKYLSPMHMVEIPIAFFRCTQ